MTLLSDLTRTVALLGDGYRITAIARGKRAQERTEMLTEAATRTDAEHAEKRRLYAMARVMSIVEDAAELVDTVGNSEAHVSIGVHSDAILMAALDVIRELRPEGATRRDYVSSETGRPAVACTVGRVTFYGSVHP